MVSWTGDFMLTVEHTSPRRKLEKKKSLTTIPFASTNLYRSELSENSINLARNKFKVSEKN